jgi:hypothetical protein
MSDELTLPADEAVAATDPPSTEPTPLPLDLAAFQRLLAQHDAAAQAHLQRTLEQRDREAEYKLQRALADLERARRDSSRTPYRDSLSPFTWGDFERFRSELFFRLYIIAEIGGFALLFILIMLAFHATPGR